MASIFLYRAQEGNFAIFSNSKVPFLLKMIDKLEAETQDLTFYVKCGIIYIITILKEEYDADI